MFVRTIAFRIVSSLRIRTKPNAGGERHDPPGEREAGDRLNYRGKRARRAGNTGGGDTNAYGRRIDAPGLEGTADQIDRLADIIDEFLMLANAGVPMSAATRQKYAAEMAELRGQRAQLRERIAAFWVLIGSKHAQ